MVNDGSSDTTSQVAAGIAAQNPHIRLIDLPKNRGRGYARSRGLAAARGEIIATVDADIILPPHWLVRTRAALHEHDAVGGVAVPDGDVTYIYTRFNLVPRVVGTTTTVTGNNGLYRRSVFDVASFDPALREGEDSSLGHAMNRQGLSCVTIPGLIVRHEENKTLGTSLRWLFDVGRGATRQLFAYHEVRQPDVVTGAFICAATLGVFMAARGHQVMGTAVPAGFVLAASVQHVRSRFETPRSEWGRFVCAVMNSALLTAYFTGRLAGVAALRKGLHAGPRIPASR